MVLPRRAIALSLVLLLMRSATWGQDDREGGAVNQTDNTQPSDAAFSYWTGRIEQDTTWCDTVYVGGDVTIASGATLTLAPNTQVHFLPYHDDTQGGLDSTRAELIVAGRLYAQAVQKDSLTVKERHRPSDIENADLRIAKKVVKGTFVMVVFTGLAMGVQDKIWEPSGGPDADTYGPIGFPLLGGAIGCSVGFPLGVSSVDPYDSLPMTLLAGVIPGAMGVRSLWVNNNASLLLWLSYFVPVMSSLAVSEASRKLLSAELKSKPQNRQVSFGLSLTPNGGLSAVTQLHF